MALLKALLWPGCDFVGESMLLGVGCEVSKAHARANFVLSLCLSLSGSRCSFWLLLQHHAYHRALSHDGNGQNLANGKQIPIQCSIYKSCIGHGVSSQQ